MLLFSQRLWERFNPASRIGLGLCIKPVSSKALFGVALESKTTIGPYLQ
jgi:hypothetical protein